MNIITPISQYLHTCVCRAERGRCLGGGAAVAEETPEDVAKEAELWRGGGGAEGGDHGEEDGEAVGHRHREQRSLAPTAADEERGKYRYIYTLHKLLLCTCYKNLL